MANILYLVHRLPYPPNKGDKVRSYHLLKHLAARHKVFLGTFVDDPEDMAFVETVRAICEDMHVSPLNPMWARLISTLALLDGRPMTLAYYSDRAMRAWVGRICVEHQIDAVVVFSSAMGQYAEIVATSEACPLLVDFVDVDSSKWAQYASKHRWPLSWIYTREGARLLEYERRLASHSRQSFFVTDNEVALFNRLAPECANEVLTVGNGVDADFFSPDEGRSNPFGAGESAIVFTGAMDYWPNIDAATWFATEMLPQLRQWDDALRLYIVGRSPPQEVLALASDGVTVTGTVADVRPYLQFATVVVAPMRVARGVQNKVLEAMAMGRPVIAATECVDAIAARSGEELIAAQSEQEYVDEVKRIVTSVEYANCIGAAGRACVLERFSWDAHLSRIDRFLPARTDPEMDIRGTHAPA
ncbi:TIGR03087 family PEP-CTERM/XrtA system glycosyltransferase [Comamonadaceae bacterium G21597-S1]|nr:TIGR03087 family PEP-CTERM/XrtA system glycosyltransferase [Comamonadaceae bacterium G21597-S1]